MCWWVWCGWCTWCVAPILDDWFLDWPWVGAGPGTDLLGYVNALLTRFEVWHQLGDVLALLLGFQVAGLLWDISHHSLGLGVALLVAGCWLAALRSA